MTEQVQNLEIQDNTTNIEDELLSGNEQIRNSPNDSDTDIQSAQSFVQEEIPRELSERYQFVRKIGSGSQGNVYLAQRMSDHLQVAIKVLRIDSLQNWKAYDLFWREVDTLKSLDIDGVAKFYEVNEQLDAAQPCAYLVQQYISGKSLSEMIRSGYRFDVSVVFQIAIQLIDLLEQLHHHEPSIIHRDLKPSNIMIEKNDAEFKVYLTDFGAVANPLLQKGGSTVAGTYGYMPPEQLMGKPEPASDIYALGATLAGLLSGMEPSEMEVVGYRLAIEKPLENLPHAIVSCLRQMTQPKIEDRLCDYAAIRSRFELFAKGLFGESDLGRNSIETSSEYDKKLNNVHALGLKENFDLWNALPEETPRMIPKCCRWRSFVRRYRIPLTFFKFSNVIQLKSTLIPLRLDPATLIRFPIYCVMYILWGVVWIAIVLGLAWMLMFILVSFMHGLTQGLTQSAADLGAVGTFVLASLGSILIFFIYFYYLYKKNFVLDKPDTKKEVTSLLQNGRKTLATVQSIQYHGVWEKCLTGYYLADGEFSRSEHEDHCKRSYYGFYSNVLPTIQISYSFNPPDDSSLTDIVHTVYVPAISEKYLKEGDLLPILYEVDPNNNSMVNSMPFPLPMSYPMYIDDMVYVSKQSPAASEQKSTNA